MVIHQKLVTILEDLDPDSLRTEKEEDAPLLAAVSNGPVARNDGTGSILKEVSWWE